MDQDVELRICPKGKGGAKKKIREEEKREQG